MMWSEQKPESGENAAGPETVPGGRGTPLTGEPLSYAWAAAAAVAAAFLGAAFVQAILPVPFAELSATGRLWLALIERQVAQREAELVLRFFEKSGDTPVVDKILEAGLLAIGAVAIFDKDTQDGG